MATDLRQKFQGNRRREVSAVAAAVPFILEEGSLRDGTSDVTLTDGEYLSITIPSNVLITDVFLVVENTNVFDGATGDDATKLGVSIGGTSVIDATDVTVPLAVKAETSIVTTGNVDVVVTADVDAGVTKGKATVIVNYIDYDRATLSYIV